MTKQNAYAQPDPRHPAQVRGANHSGQRAHNERLILSLLRTQGPLAKARIADLTGLSAQSASVIMRQLERDGLIERCPPVRGKVGQPSIPMKLAAKGASFFGLKVGRRSADLILVDFLGVILDRVKITYDYPDPDATILFVKQAVAQVMGRMSTSERQRIAGLGISIPSYLWEWAKVIGEPPEKMDAWRSRDLGQEMAPHFDFPVYMWNDGSCACDAERVFSDQDRPTEFAYFYVGHFIGGGIVLNNETFTGPTGNAGALGPLPVPVPGGGLRQLVDVSSLRVLERDMLAAHLDARQLWTTSDEWDVPEALLEHWVNRAAYGLAYAIACSCAVVDFRLVVIDGWLPRPLLQQLLAQVETEMDALSWAGLIRPQIEAGSIGADARSLGAASLPLSKRFLVSQEAR